MCVCNTSDRRVESEITIQHWGCFLKFYFKQGKEYKQEDMNKKDDK